MIPAEMMITPEGIRDALAVEFPRRTIAVGQTSWAHMLGHERHYTEYVISIQPGFDGLDNQNFGGNSFNECLTKFRKAEKDSK